MSPEHLKSLGIVAGNSHKYELRLAIATYKIHGYLFSHIEHFLYFFNNWRGTKITSKKFEKYLLLI